MYLKIEVNKTQVRLVMVIREEKTQSQEEFIKLKQGTHDTRHEGGNKNYQL